MVAGLAVRIALLAGWISEEVVPVPFIARAPSAHTVIRIRIWVCASHTVTRVITSFTVKVAQIATNQRRHRGCIIVIGIAHTLSRRVYGRVGVHAVLTRLVIAICVAFSTAQHACLLVGDFSCTPSHCIVADTRVDGAWVAGDGAAVEVAVPVAGVTHTSDAVRRGLTA